MTFERLALLRNIGQFEAVNAGAQLPLTKLSLVYAENGRGKTTLAAILRSLNSGDPALINERQRLGSATPPHIVLTFAGAPLVFQNGAWTAPLERIAVFDDAFVAAPPRQTSCRPDRTIPGGINEGRTWLDTDKDSRIAR